MSTRKRYKLESPLSCIDLSFLPLWLEAIKIRSIIACLKVKELKLIFIIFWEFIRYFSITITKSTLIKNWNSLESYTVFITKRSLSKLIVAATEGSLKTDCSLECKWTFIVATSSGYFSNRTSKLMSLPVEGMYIWYSLTLILWIFPNFCSNLGRFYTGLFG